MELYKYVILLCSTYIATMWLSVFRCSSVLYKSIMLEYETTLSQVTWIAGSYQLGLCLSNGFAPVCLEYFDARLVLIVTSVLTSAFLLISSSSTNIIFNIISLGFIPGLCMGVSLIVAFVAVPTCFKEYKTIAMQIQFIGCSVASFFFCPGLQFLINMCTWRGALIILAGFYLQISVCGALYRPSCFPKQESNIKKENQKHVHEDFYEQNSIRNRKQLEDKVSESKNDYEFQSIAMERDRNNNRAESELHLNNLNESEDKVHKFLVKHYLHLFLDLKFYLLTGAWISYGAGYYTWSSYLVVFGTQGKGLSALQAAILPSALSIGEIFSRISWGVASTRLKSDHTFTALVFVEIVTAILYISTTFLNGFYPLVIACGLIGFLLGGMDVVITLLFLTVLGERDFGASVGYSGVITQIFGLGSLRLISAAIEMSENVSWCFYIGSGCLLLSCVCLSLLKFNLARTKSAVA